MQVAPLVQPGRRLAEPACTVVVASSSDIVEALQQHCDSLEIALGADVDLGAAGPVRQVARNVTFVSLASGAAPPRVMVRSRIPASRILKGRAPCRSTKLCGSAPCGHGSTMQGRCCVAMNHGAGSAQCCSCVQLLPLTAVQMARGATWTFQGLRVTFASTPIFGVPDAAQEERAAVVRLHDCVIETLLCEGQSPELLARMRAGITVRHLPPCSFLKHRRLWDPLLISQARPRVSHWRLSLQWRSLRWGCFHAHCRGSVSNGQGTHARFMSTDTTVPNREQAARYRMAPSALFMGAHSHLAGRASRSRCAAPPLCALLPLSVSEHSLALRACLKLAASALHRAWLKACWASTMLAARPPPCGATPAFPGTRRSAWPPPSTAAPTRSGAPALSLPPPLSVQVLRDWAHSVVHALCFHSAHMHSKSCGAGYFGLVLYAVYANFVVPRATLCCSGACRVFCVSSFIREPVAVLSLHAP